MKKEMSCTPICPFFPIMESCVEWEYDENKPYIKRRKTKKNFICGYDGHIIKSWYEECPKNKTKTDNIKNKKVRKDKKK